MTSEHKVSRNKPSLSCTNCRKRKTKCDRKQPCSACVKKINLSYTCAYDTPPKQFAINSDTPQRNIQHASVTNLKPLMMLRTQFNKNWLDCGNGLLSWKLHYSMPTHQNTSGKQNYPRNKPILSPTSSTCPNPIVNDEEIINFTKAIPQFKLNVILEESIMGHCHGLP